jgi:predicted CopG family antitoxin
MATKNISITEEAYKRLASLKKANESFSEIIVRITGKADLEKFFGILSNKAADAIEKSIIDRRTENKIRRKKRLECIKSSFG